MSRLHDSLGKLEDLGARPQQSMGPADFTLERMQALMAELGHPERAYPSIHIAGTNGKGSVSAFCAAALQAEGHRVGQFTSPHLAGALEGIRIDGAAVADADLEDTFDRMQAFLARRRDWTHFEVVTALMFSHFAQAEVDAAVIEVGLGGRLDATNVLTPLVSVITAIDYDHMSILGSTLAEIAGEKAGIIKEGVPVVVSPQPAEARVEILKTAKEKRAEVMEIGEDIRFKRISSDLNGQVFQINAPHQPATQIKIGMLGYHQVENAATAFAALECANRRGLVVSRGAIERGFVAARWPGRFEVLGGAPPVVLDAAHSPAAARALRAALDEYFPGRRITMLLGVSVDKDLVGIIAPLRPRLARAIATQSAHPRAMPAAALQRRLGELGIETAAEPDARLALERAIDSAGEKSVILVCGSVFLVETVRLNKGN